MWLKPQDLHVDSTYLWLYWPFDSVSKISRASFFSHLQNEGNTITT